MVQGERDWMNTVADVIEQMEQVGLTPIKSNPLALHKKTKVKTMAKRQRRGWELEEKYNGEYGLNNRVCKWGEGC